MTKLFMMIGLPGSGKSTYAKKLAEDENAVILSSDFLRKELFESETNQEHNKEVFDELHKRVIESLNNGQSVIYDATNISAKKRTAFLSTVSKINCKKIAVLMMTSYESCLKRNLNRERVVPEEVIKRMYLQFNVPRLTEGFTDIEVIYPENIHFKPVMELVNLLRDFSQDNPHHSLTLGEHLNKAYAWLLFNYEEGVEKLNLYDRFVLIYSVLLHDIGKRHTKTFVNSRGETTNIAHYYRHEYAGAYDCFFTNMPEEVKLDVAFLIQNHMNCYQINEGSKAEAKLKRKLGDKLYTMLCILHNCDINAH